MVMVLAGTPRIFSLLLSQEGVRGKEVGSRDWELSSNSHQTSASTLFIRMLSHDPGKFNNFIDNAAKRIIEGKEKSL